MMAFTLRIRSKVKGEREREQKELVTKPSVFFNRSTDARRRAAVHVDISSRSDAGGDRVAGREVLENRHGKTFFTAEAGLTADANRHIEACADAFLLGGTFGKVRLQGPVGGDFDEGSEAKGFVKQARNRFLPLAEGLYKMLLDCKTSLDGHKEAIVQHMAGRYVSCMIDVAKKNPGEALVHRRVVLQCLIEMAIKVCEDAALHMVKWPCEEHLGTYGNHAFAIPAGTLELEVGELNRKSFTARS